MEKMPTELFTSLAEAKDWVSLHRRKGVICPCCNQIAKVYKRKLNRNMAMELIGLYKVSDNGDYVHHTKFSRKVGGEISKLVHWGLVEEKTKSDEQDDKKTSGYWRITDKGMSFVKDEINVQSHIFLFDAELLGFSDGTISIIDSLGKHFNYAELMRA